LREGWRTVIRSRSSSGKICRVGREREESDRVRVRVSREG